MPTDTRPDLGGCLTCYVVRSATYCAAHSPALASGAVTEGLDDLVFPIGEGPWERMQARIEAMPSGPDRRARLSGATDRPEGHDHAD